MKCYPLGIAGLLAVACDCIRRGDLAAAHDALGRARELAREEDRAAAKAAGREEVAA